jgi:hypothetical protein
MRVCHDVPLIPQATRYSCWAASIAMILSWKRRVLVDPASVGRGTGGSAFPSWANQIMGPLGLAPSEASRYAGGLEPMEAAAILRRWGFIIDPLRTLSPAMMSALLQRHGPLYVPVLIHGGSPHVVVVAGIDGNGSADATQVFINDPLQRGMRGFDPANTGSSYSEPFTAFERRLRYLVLQEDVTERGQAQALNSLASACLPRLGDRSYTAYLP